METTSGEYQFSVIGGRLCLDFLNTRGGSTEQPDEHIHSYADLLSFAEQNGYLGDVSRWRAAAARSPAEASVVYSRGLAFRSALHALLTAAHQKAQASPAAIERVDDEIRSAQRHYRLRSTANGFEDSFVPQVGTLDAVLAPVARSAAELLTSPELARVHVCESETCDWVFVDTSRNRSRRWCDMRDCGNRAKARKFYARKRKTSGAG